MGTATAPNNGKITLQYLIGKIYNTGFVLFNPRYPIIFQQTFKAGSHLVSLGNGILVWIQFIFISQIKNIDNIRRSTVYDISRKIKISLLFRKLCGCFHNHTESLIAPALGIAHLGNALAGDHKFLAGLGAFGNGEFLLAIQGGNIDLCAQCRLGKGDRHFAEHIHAVPFKNGVALDVNLHQHIAIGAAIAANTALTPDTEALTVIDTCRHFGTDGFLFLHLGLATADRAGILDDLTPTAAGRAGGCRLEGHAHHILGDPHLTGAVTLGTGFHLTVSAAGAVTLGAVFNAVIGDLLFHTEGRLFKGQLQLRHHIFATAGHILGALPTAAAAKTAATKNVAENVAQVAKISEAAPAAALTCAEVGVYPCVTVLVVSGLFVLIGKDFISLCNLFKVLFGLGITRMKVGVIFFCQF